MLKHAYHRGAWKLRIELKGRRHAPKGYTASELGGRGIYVHILDICTYLYIHHKEVVETIVCLIRRVVGSSALIS